MVSYTEYHVDKYSPSRKVLVTFFEKEIEVKGEDGKSHFKTMDFVTFQQDTTRDKMERFAYGEDIKKYEDIWKKYQKRKNATALTEIFDKKTSSFLKSRGIDSIEALASLEKEDAEAIAQSGMAWRQEAIEFIDGKSNSGKGDSNAILKAILNVLPKAQKDLLPNEVKKSLDAIY